MEARYPGKLNILKFLGRDTCRASCSIPEPNTIGEETGRGVDAQSMSVDERRGGAGRVCHRDFFHHVTRPGPTGGQSFAVCRHTCSGLLALNLCNDRKPQSPIAPVTSILWSGCRPRPSRATWGKVGGWRERDGTRRGKKRATTMLCDGPA